MSRRGVVVVVAAVVVLAVVSVGCSGPTIPGTAQSRFGVATYTEFVDGVPVLVQTRDVTFTFEQVNPFYNCCIVGPGGVQTLPLTMRPHEELAGQTGTWKLVTYYEADGDSYEGTLHAWPPDRSYEMVGVNPAMVGFDRPECDGRISGAFEWWALRTIDEHTTAKLRIVVC